MPECFCGELITDEERPVHLSTGLPWCFLDEPTPDVARSVDTLDPPTS